MKNLNYWINALEMTAHPEGGYYKVFYESNHYITDKELVVDFEGTRALSTSIYFLIDEKEVSNFHRLKSDEIWYYHDGQPLTIAVIDKMGVYTSYRLGLNIEAGEKPQVLVPAGSIFGSYSDQGYALVGCMVSYGFNFDDFELFKRTELLNAYPEHEEIIRKLTREEA